ncbi:MAG: CPBP family intramembrane metalloprotease [Lachnospiraceae bacterium]|nr:CPBP family intramembrane metalloprotease [Lachnospiraceae bacterium]
MNGKKVTLAFIAAMLLDLLCAWVIKNYFPQIADNLVLINLICEATILLPGLVFVFASGEKFSEFMGFHKIKPGTLFALIPFTMFTTPFITLLNLITQFFTENAAVNMMTDYNMAEMSLGQMFFSIAVFAPFCEELTCRGVYYRGYKKGIRAFWAMIVSSLLFGLMHMNINQAVYAFGMGILAVLLVEATGSIWSSVIYHGLVNGSQVILMYLMLKMDSGTYVEAASQQITTDMLVYSVALYLVITAVCLPLGWAILVWMGEHQGRPGVLRGIWEDKKIRRKE